MEAYLREKESLKQRDLEIGQLPVLTEAERSADQVLKRLRSEFLEKFSYIDMGNFYRVSEAVKSTALFEVLYIMPKGATLHLHFMATLHSDWFMNEIRTNPAIYFHVEREIFSVNKAGEEGFVKAVDYFAPGDAQREALLRRQLTLDEETGAGSSIDTWKHFGHYFLAIADVFHYVPVLKKYLLETCRVSYEEGVTRIEMKHLPGKLFTDEGVLSYEEEAQLLTDTLEEFYADHPGFSVGFVYSGFKGLSAENLEVELRKSYALHKQFPKICIGYDLVGEEQTLRANSEYSEIFVKIKQQAEEEGYKFPFFLHGGEFTMTDLETLYDILAVGTSRIGHGIDLHNHPYLMQYVREKGILVECSPLSNLCLKYVTDMRIHPALTYFKHGIKVSINSDDPGLFGYSGVTHDFLYVTVLWNLGLAELLKMVRDSIDCSTEPELTRASWEDKWEEFIAHLNSI